MSLEAKQADLLRILGKFSDGQERLGYLVGEARKRPNLGPEDRQEANRVEGCMSRLWLVARFDRGCCWFRCDSDSAIVKGIAGLLCDFYSGGTPEAILAHAPDFLASAGITQHLTPNRRNGLSRVWETIRGFALAHRAGVGPQE
jgi:cysteine desulfuration protein SufE